MTTLLWTRRRNKHSLRIERRIRVIQRDGAVCRHCPSTTDLTLDHIVPKSKGGTNNLANLQILCEPCNREKADRL